jgi:GNAT superfamily N-acetyltransferase
VTWTVEVRDYTDPDVALLVAAVQQEYVVRYGGPDDAVVDPVEFSPPNGLFLVGLLDGVPVAMGGWRAMRYASASDTTAASIGPTASAGLIDSDTAAASIGPAASVDRVGSVAEIKRMYVAASARRRGLARVMLAELESRAAAAGVREFVLNTGTEQPEAVALYESSGYTPVPGFGHYAAAPLALFYGKQLPAPS